MEPLLAPGEDPHMNACLNYGLDHWDLYAMGYRIAADVILDHVRETHADQDGLIFPFLFMWRHHLELTLKGIGRQAAQILGQDWTPPIKHDLTRLLDAVRGMVDACFADYSTKLPQVDATGMGDALAAIGRIDGKSMAFRYPEDRDGHPYLAEATHINFEVVSTHMTSIADSLEFIQTVLDLIEEARADEASAYGLPPA